MEGMITIERHILNSARSFPGATGSLTNLLYSIALAGKVLSLKLKKGALSDLFGAAGGQNVQGEEVQKLDLIAQDTFTSCLDFSGNLCGMLSEEEADVIPIPDSHPKGKYLIAFDPLDGSSNIDVCASIGTIFSILEKKKEGLDCCGTDFLQKGYQQVAAGYVIYGSSTMMIYTTRGGTVNGFTLDPTIGEFLLTHPDIKIPATGQFCSLNETAFHQWPEYVKNYVHYIKKQGKHKMRYIGSMVGDFHRNLLKGGVFIYPQSDDYPDGKLRLLYEINPIAFIARNAGGTAITTTNKKVLEIKPTTLHQRGTLVVGSLNDVRAYQSFYETSLSVPHK